MGELGSITTNANFVDQAIGLPSRSQNAHINSGNNEDNLKKTQSMTKGRKKINEPLNKNPIDAGFNRFKNQWYN